MLRYSGKLFLYAASLFTSFGLYAQPVTDLMHHQGDPMTGNAKGKVTIVEFFDYQCSHCAKMAPVVTAVVKRNPDVRVVYKDFPIRGPQSEFAARAALAANMQDKYLVFSHALLESSNDLSETKVMDIAKSVGLNIDKLKRDMNSKKVDDALKSNMATAQEFNLTGTPAFFIGKTDATDSSELTFVLGEMSPVELQNAIKKVSN